MTKPVVGYLAEDGTFFEREVEARRHDAIAAIRRYCDSQQPPIDADAFLRIVDATGLSVFVYLTTQRDEIEEQDGTTEEQESIAAQDADDLDAEIEEAAKRKARLFEQEDDFADTLESEPDDSTEADTTSAEGDDDDAEQSDPEPDRHLLSDQPASTSVPQVGKSSANNREGARNLRAIKQLSLRRPVALSDLGGSPLPTAVPEQGKGDGS